MKNKKANRLFSIYYKNLNNLKIHRYRILTTIIILLTLLLQGNKSVNIYSQNLQNPFYDVFYNYSNNMVKKAKKQLRDMFDNPKLRTHAYINYGLIHEYEKNYKKAEKYYYKALKEGDNIALVYLYDLYKKHNLHKSYGFLQSPNVPRLSYWIDYERAIYYLKQGEEENAIECLRAAISKGFNSPTLILRDPIFDKLRDSVVFKEIISEARKNSITRKSLLEELQEDEYEYRRDKPYGIIKRLQIVADLEKKGSDEMAEELLSSLVKSRISFRDKSIALFWMARIKSKNRKFKSAKRFLNEFIDHLNSEERDHTGYKKLIAPIYKDIIQNDIYLKDLLQ